MPQRIVTNSDGTILTNGSGSPVMGVTAGGVPNLSGFLPPDLNIGNSVTSHNAARGGDNDVGSVLVFSGRAQNWTGSSSYVNGTKGGTFSTSTSVSPIAYAVANGIVPVLSLPLLAQVDSKDFQGIIDGDYNVHYDAVIDKMDAIVGHTSAKPWILRLAWEAQTYVESEWYSQAQGALYGQAWAHIVSRFRARFPDNMKTNWCNLKRNSARPDWGYPGSDAVDIIGVDYYDRNDVHVTGDDVSPNGFMWKWNNEANNHPIGLYRWAEYARGKGKPLSVDEWGLWHKENSTSCEGNSNLDDTGGGDNAAYIQLMYNFFKANKDIIYSETYFSRCPNSINYDPTNAAKTKYYDLWSTHWKDT